MESDGKLDRCLLASATPRCRIGHKTLRLVDYTTNIVGLAVIVGVIGCPITSACSTPLTSQLCEPWIKKKGTCCRRFPAVD